MHAFVRQAWRATASAAAALVVSSSLVHPVHAQGALRPEIGKPLQAAKDLMNDLIFQAYPAGFSSLCYDDQYFFDTDHPVFPNADGTGAPTTWSNFTTGAGAALYVAGVADTIADGIARAREAIATGAARARLDTFVRVTRELAADAGVEPLQRA